MPSLWHRGPLLLSFFRTAQVQNSQRDLQPSEITALVTSVGKFSTDVSESSCLTRYPRLAYTERMGLSLKGTNPNLCLPYSSAATHRKSAEFTTHTEPSALFIIPKDVVQKL